MEAAQKFGKSWSKEQFAGFGAKGNAGSHKSGAFAARLSALRDYGLITTDKESVAATELAQVIAKPINLEELEKSKQEAFLNVSTFRDIYESLEMGTALPRDKFAGYAVAELGVSRDSMEKFVNVFVDSGAEVGLVDYNKDLKEITLKRRTGGIMQPVDVDSELTEADERTVEESNTTGLFVAKVPTVSERPEQSRATMNEQGVNHSGDGWALTVLIKSARRLPEDVRTQIRNLLDEADRVADKFYELEGKGN